MKSEIVKLLLAATVAAGLTACDGGDKGKAANPQASGVKAVASAAAAGSSAAGATMSAASPAINAIDRSHAGTPAPAVTFEKRGGGTARLADFKGRRVLVNLWATWCAPCVAEMPDLDRLATARAATLLVLPLSQDMEGWRVVDKFVARRGFKTLAPMLDQPGAFAEAVKARGLPMSILYDAQGREVWRVAGTLQWSSAAVGAAL